MICRSNHANWTLFVTSPHLDFGSPPSSYVLCPQRNHPYGQIRGETERQCYRWCTTVEKIPRSGHNVRVSNWGAGQRTNVQDHTSSWRVQKGQFQRHNAIPFHLTTSSQVVANKSWRQSAPPHRSKRTTQ
jgi:hypothetical protein